MIGPRNARAPPAGARNMKNQFFLSIILDPALNHKSAPDPKNIVIKMSRLPFEKLLWYSPYCGQNCANYLLAPVCSVAAYHLED